MNSGFNQRTLFQTWGTSVSQSKSVPPKTGVKKAPGRRRTTPNSTSQEASKPASRSSLWCETGDSPYSATVSAEDQDDDSLMVVAVYEAEQSLHVQKAPSNQEENSVGTDYWESGQTYPDLPGFDSSSSKVWIYPTNFPIREYQLKMSEAALFQNTLVCLPTGLGKTFIASVVMYNFYRWYPSGKIVFMAPTKPLVAQQIEACYKVMGIPQAHMAELTGSTAAKQRQEVWRSKRVFFLTPQVMVNDLSRDTCPAQQVKCVVIDEAHKALGNHAYCQVVRLLASQTRLFRILALSATPGGDTKSVQSVISNLLISHIELRSEESPDIQAHSHQRSVDKMVVPLGEALSSYQTRYLQVLEKFMSRLVQNRVMTQKDLRTLSKYQLILARDQFRKNPPQHIKGPQQGMLEGDFALCISLYHGYELLMQMGLRSLFFYIQGVMDGSREMSRARNELQRTPAFMDLYNEMEAMFVKPADGLEETFIYSHPKLERLEQVVLQHFRQWAERTAGSDEAVGSRVMIFSSFRESVQEIADMLKLHAPLIRVMTFMGQASVGKGVKGFTQKEQLEVVQRFRQGGFNTLVSTCVGEEGLDIGEVDLIVCFDAQKNPIRLVQRMGRTGRKRQGRIVVILAEGREERTYNQSQSNRRSVYKSILSHHSGFIMYSHSPRMLPPGVSPTLHKMHITCGHFEPEDSSRRSVKRRTSLIHPHALMQGSSVSDGFLSSAEYLLWASTMKLDEDEASPTLRPSHFVSLPTHASSQQVSSSGPSSEELSLCEWRHWQHKSFPIHSVDHSLRCKHFIQIMKLIDQMKEENEGECRYEEELRPYLCEASNSHVKNAQKKLKPCAKTSTAKTKRPSLFDNDFIDQELEMNVHLQVEQTSREQNPDAANIEMPSPISLNSNCILDDCAISKHEKTNLVDDAIAHISKQNSSVEEDLQIHTTFYLPNWDYPLYSKKSFGRLDSLKVILSNVSELLSRSPQSLDLLNENMDFMLPNSKYVSPRFQPQYQPFQVSFTLSNDDEEDEEIGIVDNSYLKSDLNMPVKQKEILAKESSLPNSPTWDDVFEDDVLAEENEEVYARTESGQKHHRDMVNMEEHNGVDQRDSPLKQQMDESMDLFGDDEAFLQMSIPDVTTPEELPTSPPKQEDHTKTMYNVSFKKCPQSFELEGTQHGNGILSGRTHNSQTDKEEICKTATLQQNPDSFECSNDLFSVNFDLDFTSSEEEMIDAPSPQPQNLRLSLQAASSSSTPYTSHHKPSQCAQSRAGRLSSSLSAPQRNISALFSSRVVPPPISTAQAPAPRVTQNHRETLRWSSVKQTDKDSSDSEDEEVVVRKRKQHNKVDLLSSPESSRNISDVDSPLVLKRKRTAALNTSSEMEGGAVSEEDFQNDSVFTQINPESERRVPHKNKYKLSSRRAHHFLDEEAALSEDEDAEGVSSDEDDGEDLNQSLEGFVVDNSHFSQGLNDSEMHGVYLNSVRSPAVLGKFKMSFRNQHHTDIFSQVPELDETYAEDSFVVGSDEEELTYDKSEDEEVCPLIPEQSYVDGRRQYATRRRVLLHHTSTSTSTRPQPDTGGSTRVKRSRLICIQDSSEEETEPADQRATDSERPASAKQDKTGEHKVQSSIASKVSLMRAQRASTTNEEQNERCRQKLENQHLLSDQLDFMEPQSALSPEGPWAPSHSGASPVCILVDSRCLSGSVQLMTCLRQCSSTSVHVCSLDNSYFIVSVRMAVWRHSQSELASAQNRKRLVEKVNSVLGLFDRVCLIIEKDRIKPGDTARPFHRSRYYDSTLSALLRLGLRLLWSNSPEESAVLLVELGRLEQRKSQGICVCPDVKGALQTQALHMYVSLPSVNYVHALYMSYNFSTVSQLINSSVADIQKGGGMTRSRAEELYRLFRYSCDSFLMNTSKTNESTQSVTRRGLC